MIRYRFEQIRNSKFTNSWNSRHDSNGEFKMHTITVYNENEVKELNDIQNIQGEDKVWIDLVDPYR